MKYANFNNQRIEAFKGGRATCPLCEKPVIAKCGLQRFDHWAHKVLSDCKYWREKETEWHRNWKDKFSKEFQEFIQLDELGEKHIADIRTNHDLVIEFQHSHIDPQERISREQFYKNMAWVVDGTRLKRDIPRFRNGQNNLRSVFYQWLFITPFPDESFPADWLESSAPVFFDFLGLTPKDPPDVTREFLWCLLPGRAEGNAVVILISQNDFLLKAKNGPHLLLDAPAKEIVALVAQKLREIRSRANMVPPIWLQNRFSRQRRYSRF